jgi:NAD(P)H-dependent FMN reductase
VALKIGIVLGSTRPGRRGDQVARWVLENAKLRGDAEYDIIDLLDYPLPHLDEAIPASAGKYANEHTHEWAERIAQYDGYIFVTPEYNHSTSGVLKNAIDFLYAEWINKAAGFVSYGAASGGIRAVEHLRLIVAELQIADVRQQVTFAILTDFENMQTLTPGPRHLQNLGTMLDQVVSWSGALKTVREVALAAAA